MKKISCLFALFLSINYLALAQINITLSPSQDAAIGYNDGFNTGDGNYGNATNLSAFKFVGNDPNGFNENEGLLQFDYSAIPQGATITGAKLNLYAFTDGSTQGHVGPNNQFYVQRVTQSWVENTVTWNNRPTSTTANAVSLQASTAANQDYTNIDVLALVQDMLTSGNNGFVIKLINNTVGSGVLFCSEDYSNPLKHPTLEISYTLSCVTNTPLYDAAIGYNDGFNDGSGNYGNATNVCAFKFIGNDTNGFNENRGLLQFDLTVVPQNATLTSAKLNLYAYTDGSTQGHAGVNNQFYLQRVTQPWTESVVSWNNQPAGSTQNQVLQPSSTSANQDYLNIDVLALVNDMLVNGNNGIMLKMVNEVVGNGVFFCSEDYSNALKHPTLELCWETPTESFENNIVVKNVVLFPNPANTFATLQLDGVKSAKASISIINTLGQVVNAENLNLQKGKNIHQLNTAALSNGLYYIVLNIDNKQVHTQKLIKQ